MPGQDFGYGIIIEKDHCELSDIIHACMVSRVTAPYLDVGCNTGWLLKDVAGGVGLDATWALAQRAKSKELNVVWGWGEHLPFADKSFACVVLSGVLEQCVEPVLVLREALRVGRRVIGINPCPDSPWGKASQSPWVKSVLESESFAKEWNARVGRCAETHWWFEIE